MNYLFNWRSIFIALLLLGAAFSSDFFGRRKTVDVFEDEEIEVRKGRPRRAPASLREKVKPTRAYVLPPGAAVSIHERPEDPGNQGPQPRPASAAGPSSAYHSYASAPGIYSRGDYFNEGAEKGTDHPGGKNTQLGALPSSFNGGTPAPAVDDADAGTDGGIAVSPLDVLSISPSQGSTAGSTNITITGSGFQAGAAVTLDGVSCTSIAVDSVSQITCLTPAHSLGTVDVSVENPDGQADTLANAFIYTQNMAGFAVNAGGTARAVSTNLMLKGSVGEMGSSELTGASMKLRGGIQGVLYE